MNTVPKLVSVLILILSLTAHQNAMAEEQALNVAEWSAASEILLTAKQLIVDKGWQQAAPDKVDAECMATALEHAWQKSGKSLVDFNYAREALARATGMPAQAQRFAGDPLDLPYWGRNLMYWNDAEGRTEEQVLAAFDKAVMISGQNLAKAKAKNLSFKAIESYDRKLMFAAKLIKQTHGNTK